MRRGTAIGIVIAVAIVVVTLALSVPKAGAAGTRYRITINGPIAEDSCSRLRVVEYEGGLNGSTYRCAFDD